MAKSANTLSVKATLLLMTLCLVSISPEAVRGRVLGGVTTAFFLGLFLSPLFSQPLGEAIGLGHTYGVAGGMMGAMAVMAAIAL